MPTGTRTQTLQRLAILLGPHSSAALALLLRGAFDRANRLLPAPFYAIDFVSARGTREISLQGVTIPTRRLRGRCDYLLIPPYDGLDRAWQPLAEDVALIERQHRCGGIVASACLGALTVAAAGVLEGVEATTHWDWGTEARTRHPGVRWNLRRILCDEGRVITAGGYLAAVDLALHIVAATSSRATAHALGRLMLADSSRQYQSIYAQRLLEPTVPPGALGGMASWIERRLKVAPSAAQMARHCGMSLRSFHRKFREAFGVTPRKFVQLKRIESVRQLLADRARSTEDILEQVGVSDRTSFRRVFQRELGYSLVQYRRLLSPSR